MEQTVSEERGGEELVEQGIDEVKLAVYIVSGARCG